MSQAGQAGGGGGGGSSVNQINTQSGNATPISDVIILNGYDTTENNVFGIETKGNTNGGNPPGTGTTNETDVYLTNRFHGSGTTTDATPTTISTCPMTTNPATFQFVVNLVAYDVTDNSSLATVATLSFRTTGGVPVLLSNDDFVTQEDAAGAFPAATAINFNGSSTQFSVIVTGVAGKTIKWLCHGTYTVVS
jgi:hypothetical protein